MSHGDPVSFVSPVDFRESGNKSMRDSFESERGGNNSEGQIGKGEWQEQSPILGSRGSMLDEEGFLKMAENIRM